MADVPVEETRTVVHRIEDGQGNVISETMAQVAVQPVQVDPVQQLQDAVDAMDAHEIEDPALAAVADAVRALAAAQPGRRPRRKTV